MISRLLDDEILVVGGGERLFNVLGVQVGAQELYWRGFELAVVVSYGVYTWFSVPFTGDKPASNATNNSTQHDNNGATK